MVLRVFQHRNDAAIDEPLALGGIVDTLAYY